MIRYYSGSASARPLDYISGMLNTVTILALVVLLWLPGPELRLTVPRLFARSAAHRDDD